jgi:hypothetical protein
MMTTMQMIKEGIANWNNICHDGELLGTYFEQGNSFLYEAIDYPIPSPHFHAYPGIWEGQLLFFVIPSSYDKPEYEDTLNEYTQAYPVTWGLNGSHTLPDPIAEARMHRWTEHYKNWAKTEVKKPAGMFKAFQVPADDFGSDYVQVVFGLQLVGHEGIMSADLICASVDAKAYVIKYDDFTQPVPPFTATLTEDSFYMLNA